MTWTYFPDDLPDDPIMQLRLMIGDIEEDNQLTQDEELEYWLSVEGGVRQAAIAVLEALAAKYSKRADRTIGPLKITWSQVAATLCSRAQGLRIDRLALGAVPYAGGLSKDEKHTDQLDSDRVEPFFTRERFETYVPTQSPRSPWY
jgi:hypothetical protein